MKTSFIEVNNLTKSRVNKEFLKGLAKKTLAGKEFNLSIALVGQGRIKELNKRYRKKDKPTDVLSFRYDDWGEVVICPEEVKKNAQQFKVTYQKELARVLVHGVLHILGYNHQQMKQRNG